MPTQTINATIPSGDYQTPAVDLWQAGANNGAVLLGVQMPAAWTTAALTFLVSADGDTYVPLYRIEDDGDAAEVKISIPAASKAYNLQLKDFAAWRYVKLRSGVDGTNVNQAAARTLMLRAERVG